MIVTSLVEFLNELEKNALNLYGDNNKRAYFRGESADYKENRLLPKVFRTDLDSGEKRFIEQKEYIRAIRRRPEEFNNMMTKLDILSKMQHFGIATRLLDYTTNPLVALYFACQESGDDGYVYIVFGQHKWDDEANNNIIIVSYDDPIVAMISNFATLSNEEQELYKKIINFFNQSEPTKIYLKPTPNYFETLEAKEYYESEIGDFFNEFTTEEINLYQRIQLSLSSNSSKEYPLFTNFEIFPNEVLSSYFVKPVFTNQNIQKQQGLFCLSGLNKKIVTPDYTFKIPKQNKQKILAELKFFAGIDKESLFSGLSGIANNNKEKLFKEFLKMKNE